MAAAVVNAVRLGETGSREALALQLDDVERRARGKIPGALLTHSHVYAFGGNGRDSSLLVSRDTLRSDGIAVEPVSRGGDITYHGPGRLVGAPLVLVSQPDRHRHIRALAAAFIDAIARFGVPGRAVSGLTGVWTGDSKIASIGVGVCRCVTDHGFALGASTELSHFRRIHLCGLKGKEPTSNCEHPGGTVEKNPARDAVTAACGRRVREIA